MTKFIYSNKLKILISLFIVVIAGTIAVRSKEQALVKDEVKEKKAIEVGVKKVSDFKVSANKLRFAGVVAGDQEVKITSQANGIVQAVNFDIGDNVLQGKVLATIDDQGGYLTEGANNFSSAQVQQLELAVKQAREAYELAKERYDDDKSDANKTARDIAKLQYETAKLGLSNSLNSRTIIASISGAVTSRQVSVGDSVYPGQTIATISKTKNNKVQFYLSAEEIKNLSKKISVKIKKADIEIDAKISNISPQADAATKKFLIEAIPEKGNELLLGEVVDVWVDVSKVENSESSNVYVPLSAITNTQTGSYVFIAKDGFAKKIAVAVMNIFGETGVIKGDFSLDDEMITEGNKLLSDGDKIQIK